LARPVDLHGRGDGTGRGAETTRRCRSDPPVEPDDDRGGAGDPGDVIVPTPALRHEAWDRPVAFLGDVEIVPLLGQIRSGRTAHAIVQAWSDRVSNDLGWRIMRWLWSHRVVVSGDR